ncbi:phage tail protein [Gallibacterium sp. AGMB14963]|uniref:phage tail protein n=1 Tax=Gallibacterium faecale TaxID=3019086 RepID=UPI0022F188D0|nr:phage tail protein [Gallibacterium sp. AGMB14963]MDA3979047.1 phage tail protein [Gallibacterium sp. AGMB14963]
MNIKLPFWMDGLALRQIADLFAKWWEYSFKKLIDLPLKLLDEDNCSETMLNLIAYARDVERFENEPLSLFRKRVKYAFINAQDAGSKAGFIRIFERLGIGYVEIEERFDTENWDVIKIILSDSQVAHNKELLNLIIRKYGRTCRRYTFEVITKLPIYLTVRSFDNEYICYRPK